MNIEFLDMVKKRQKSKNKAEIKHLGKKAQALRVKLQNDYFMTKANEVNVASEMRNTEEEFCRG